MKSNKICKRVVVAVLLLGLFSSLYLCGYRVGREANNDRVALAMTVEDAARIQNLPEIVQLFDGGNIFSGALLLVEDENQYSHNPIVGNYLPDALGPDRQLRQVRCFYLYPQYAARYNYLGYPGSEEIENILYRAVTDRNIRVLWLSPFVDAESGEVITDGAVYGEVIENLTARLAKHGLQLGDSFTMFRAYTPPAALLLLSAFGVAAAWVLLMMRAFGLKEKWGLLLLAVGCLGCAGLYALRVSLAVPVFALAAAVVFPCLALQRGARRLSAGIQTGLAGEMGLFARDFAECFFIALAGGFFVGALQSSTEYLLAIDNFRGVKISQLLPLLAAVWVLLRQLCPLREILSGKKYILVLAVLVLLAGLALFILRTGDGLLSVSSLEQRFRNWLEHILLVRPRTKEFLVAWPCFGLAYVLCRRGAKRFCWPFFILSAPGFSSVVNTFCHSRAPIWVSTVRGLLGALIGLAIGLILTALFHKQTGKIDEITDKN